LRLGGRSGASAVAVCASVRPLGWVAFTIGEEANNSTDSPATNLGFISNLVMWFFERYTSCRLVGFRTAALADWNSVDPECPI
jgi:hypothetical protein